LLRNVLAARLRAGAMPKKDRLSVTDFGLRVALFFTRT